MSRKTVLITGSSKGLGHSLAKVFAENKYNIILHGRNEGDLERIKKIILQNGVECDVIKGDITKDTVISKLYRAAERRKIEILINNAGTYLNKNFQSMKIEEFKRVIEVNLIAPVALIKRIFPLLKRKKTGLIININSLAGKNPNYMESAYCASKYGLRGFTKSFKYEAIKYNVRIIDVYPGVMNTDIIKGRIEPDECIQTGDIADLIYRICKDYSSLRIDEIELCRRKY